LAQEIRCQERVAADVVDLVEAVGVVAQNHVRGGAGGRRRVRLRHHEEAMLTGGVGELSDDLAHVVDAVGNAVTGGQGIIGGEEGAAAEEVAVPAVARVAKLPDDLARIVDGARIGDRDRKGVVKGGVSAAGAATVEKAMGAAGVLEESDDLARIVDAFCKGAGGQWDVEGDERAVGVAQEAMVAAGTEIVEVPDDLARGVDAGGFGAEGGVGIIDGGENAPAEQEAMGIAPGESPDDQPRVVDGKCPGVGAGRQGVVDRGEGASAQQEAMGAAGVVELADDLAHVVNVERQGRPRAGSRVVDRGEDVHWHVVGLLVA